MGLWPFLPVLGPTSAPVVESSRSEDHGEFIGHLSTVAPSTPGFIPEVVPSQKAHHPLRKALPHHKGKVHLQREGFKRAVRRDFLTKILIAYGGGAGGGKQPA